MTKPACTRRTGPSIAGQRPENNTFTLDGVSNNNYYSTGPLVVVSNDAIAEVSLLQNQFSAEFGGASGGVFNAIVKSGTNTIHGSIFEFFQNRKLNAVDSLDCTQGLTSLPRYDNNRLGASIGGLGKFSNWARRSGSSFASSTSRALKNCCRPRMKSVLPLGAFRSVNSVQIKIK